MLAQAQVGYYMMGLRRACTNRAIGIWVLEFGKGHFEEAPFHY
jgi:hypothetical protein